MSKYRAIKTGKHASRKESRRATELALMQQAGMISQLEEQVKYELIPKQDGERAVHYVCDFRYVENAELIVEDVKGMKTPIYILKRKLLLFRHGIKIKET